MKILKAFLIISNIFLFDKNFVLCLNNKCSNEWIVKINDENKVDAIANLTGFSNKGQIQPFENIYKFTHLEINNSDSDCHSDITDILNKNTNVNLALFEIIFLI
jgi:hypothetical protein